MNGPVRKKKKTVVESKSYVDNNTSRGSPRISLIATVNVGILFQQIGEALT
jgi:hypothetical protein